MKNVPFIPHALLVAAALLTGCAGPNVPLGGGYPAPVSGYPVGGASYGTVESIQLMQGGGAAAGGIGTGAVVGGVVGGLLGNQVGGGSGRKAATVAGVIGGAMVGHQIERGNQARNLYQIGIRMDNGTYRTVQQESTADLHVGGRVRVDNDRAYRY